jgi:hypothetical protein
MTSTYFIATDDQIRRKQMTLSAINEITGRWAQFFIGKSMGGGSDAYHGISHGNSHGKWEWEAQMLLPFTMGIPMAS